MLGVFRRGGRVDVMRLRPPREGFCLAWGGDVGLELARNGPTWRRPDLQAALDAEAATYDTPPAQAAAEWAPITSDLLERIRDGLHHTK